ncbi:MAG: NAD+ synthase [Candidatus Omnitrophica bacterium]|nr:NAD+ synthase [Candidatus Omnitrophota bacterium]
MKNKIRLAIAQINCTVGDLEGNVLKITDHLRKAEVLGVDIVSFPELAITGYPPEDLLLKSSFIDDNIIAIGKVAKSVGNIVAVVGFVDRKRSDIYNAAAIIHKGKIAGVCYKMSLPNYGVFDEFRYFTAAPSQSVFRLGNILFGANICEDIWHKEGSVAMQAAKGADLIINISSSPYYMGKIDKREEMVRYQAKTNNVFISYTNMVGGQDELVFDGQSMIVDHKGKVISRAAAFKEDFLVVDIDIPAAAGRFKKAVTISYSIPATDKPDIPAHKIKQPSAIAEVYEALLLGLGDYVRKNGFKEVVIGLSGGIDSSIVASIAVDALGKNNVIGVFMPTRYSSEASLRDAGRLAENLGIRFMTISIEQLFKLYMMALDSKFSGSGRDKTEENLQARIRGNMLMALSNKFGWMVLTTGNKSEMSTGYATLYGDMAGGFAVIKDVPKTLVYKLALYRNSISSIIPEDVLTKEPTAELRPDQKDSDTLPPYDMLDKILKSYIEEDRSSADIVKTGFDKDIVAKVVSMVDNSEYKRRQAPPGIKITPKAFGKDRRMPITNKYR